MSYEEVKKQHYQAIREWFKTMPNDTKISFYSYLDHSYIVGGYPQINHTFSITNKEKQINYNAHSKFQNMEWLPDNINIYQLRQYLVNTPSDKYVKETTDYNRGLRFYQFNDVPICEFLKQEDIE